MAYIVSTGFTASEEGFYYTATQNTTGAWSSSGGRTDAGCLKSSLGAFVGATRYGVWRLDLASLNITCNASDIISVYNKSSVSSGLDNTRIRVFFTDASAFEVTRTPTTTSYAQLTTSGSHAAYAGKTYDYIWLYNGISAAYTDTALYWLWDDFAANLVNGISLSAVVNYRRRRT